MKEIEALNVVRQMVADGQVSQEVAEKYFPELAESEDERMKKAIYYVIANTPYGLISNTGFTIFQMKNWLDKQGEQKSAVIIPKFKVGDKIKLAKEPKYTPSEIVAIKNDAYYFDEFVHLPFSRQDEWELVGQKSSWSEEDEKLINSVIELIDDGALDRDEKDYFIEKLKSLKDRVQPQPHWKPSEEQIKAVRLARAFVVDDFYEHPSLSEILIELEEQLKKLREE